MKTKVLQVIPTLSAGGAEGFIANLGVSLAELGVDVRFFLPGGVRGDRGQVLFNRLRNAAIDVRGTEPRKPASLRNVLRLAGLIMSWRPHIVQANLYSAEMLCAAVRLLVIGSGACFVRRLADTDQCGYRPARIVRQLDRAYRLSIACSPAVADAARTFINRRGASRLIAISNGGHFLDSVPTSGEKALARARLGIPDNTYVVCHIGRMWPGRSLDGGLAAAQKAHDVLLKSFSTAFRNDARSLLLCVGDGPLRGDAERLAQDLGVGERVRFLGEQPDPWTALSAADVFFFPSRHEGLPNALLEAASCGLPVVASDIPEIRSLSPGEVWKLQRVDDIPGFAEALRRVRAARSEFLYGAHAIAGPFRAKFSMRRCAKEYLRAYESALSGAKLQPPEMSVLRGGE